MVGEALIYQRRLKTVVQAVAAKVELPQVEMEPLAKVMMVVMQITI